MKNADKEVIQGGENLKVESSLDLRYNIAAMCVAILREDIATPEQAFAILEEKGIKTAYTDEDVEDMTKLYEQGLCYEEIGRIYGLSKYTIRRRIERYRKKDLSDGNLKVQCK